MFRFSVIPRGSRAGLLLWAAGLALLLFSVGATSASSVSAATLAKIQGKVIGTDTGEPIGFADVLLIPADTTMRKVGGLTNADGTFLLEGETTGRASIRK